jgi:hypothetical protein
MDDRRKLEERVDALEQELALLKERRPRGIRKRSKTIVWGLPLWEIAVGPDLNRGEMRGYAKAIIAIGDIATGVVAIGGLAGGVIAFGGLALGLGLSIGGLAIGSIAGGGGAVGGFAAGGAAVGYVAVGGGAVGRYACGGGASGTYVVSAMRRDPEAARFFREEVPFPVCPESLGAHWGRRRRPVD